jgi:hypothetical protein
MVDIVVTAGSGTPILTIRDAEFRTLELLDCGSSIKFRLYDAPMQGQTSAHGEKTYRADQVPTLIQFFAAWIRAVQGEKATARMRFQINQAGKFDPNGATVHLSYSDVEGILTKLRAWKPLRITTL